MTSLAQDNLTQEKIQQLLAAVGSSPDKDMQQEAGVTEYNWQISHYFNHDQLGKISKFADGVAKNIAEKFKQIYNSDFEVTVSSTVLYFASELIKSDSNAKSYFIAFGDDKQQIGLITMQAQTAILWATQLLGDNQAAQDTERELSQLEQSLFLDITSALIGAFSGAYTSKNLIPVGEIIMGKIPMEIDNSSELCKITIGIKKAGSEVVSEVCFWVFCEKLHQVAEQKQADNISPQNVSKAMMNYVATVPVTVTALLAQVGFNFQQLMTLQVDDVLMLNKKITEPAELIVEGKAVFKGRLAKSDSKYALLVTELCNN